MCVRVCVRASVRPCVRACVCVCVCVCDVLSLDWAMKVRVSRRKLPIFYCNSRLWFQVINVLGRQCSRCHLRVTGREGGGLGWSSCKGSKERPVPGTSWTVNVFWRLYGYVYCFSCLSLNENLLYGRCSRRCSIIFHKTMILMFITKTGFDFSIKMPIVIVVH